MEKQFGLNTLMCGHDIYLIKMINALTKLSQIDVFTVGFIQTINFC
jgi:hypothetical protein